MQQLTGTVLATSYSADFYDGRLKAIATALREGEKLDLNSLSFEDRQVAGALVDSGEAVYVEHEGRSVVQLSYLAQHPLLSIFVMMFSMGSRGCTPLQTD